MDPVSLNSIPATILRMVDGGVSIPFSECLDPAQIRYLSFVDCIGLEA